MAAKQMDVSDIRFTQEHVWDSFNNNSAKAGGILELIKEILDRRKTPDDLPLIRVAWKQGAYWCVDNRRLFVYKHCQLGEIPVRVFHWKDNKEFELKWRNGWSTRTVTGEGRRVGLMQRMMDTPLPNSPVAEPSLSDIAVYLSPEQQDEHDARITALRARRERQAKELDRAAIFAACDAEKDALCRLLSAPRALAAHAEEPEGGAHAKPASKNRAKKKKCQSTSDRGGRSSEAAVVHEADSAAGRPAKKKKKRRAAADEEARGGAAAASEASHAPKRKKRRSALAAAGRESAGGEVAKTAMPAAQAGAAVAVKARPQGDSQARLTVALGQEDSEDEAYDVEVTVM